MADKARGAAQDGALEGHALGGIGAWGPPHGAAGGAQEGDRRLRAECAAHGAYGEKPTDPRAAVDCVRVEP